MDKYGELLNLYCSDNNLLLLIDCLRKESEREMEIHFIEHGKYPEQRNLISKLLFDLDIAKEATKIEEE